jgi:hypothetical protein
MDDFEAFKADVATPFFEIGRGIHMVVDVANLFGVTSDESMEKKIDSLRFVERRIRRVNANKRVMRRCAANHPDDAINSRQLE